MFASLGIICLRLQNEPKNHRKASSSRIMTLYESNIRTAFAIRKGYYGQNVFFKIAERNSGIYEIQLCDNAEVRSRYSNAVSASHLYNSSPERIRVPRGRVSGETFIAAATAHPEAHRLRPKSLILEKRSESIQQGIESSLFVRDRIRLLRSADTNTSAEVSPSERQKGNLSKQLGRRQI